MSPFPFYVGHVINSSISFYFQNNLVFVIQICYLVDSFLPGHFQVTGVGINTEWGLLMASVSEDTGEETPLQVSSQFSLLQL